MGNKTSVAGVSATSNIFDVSSLNALKRQVKTGDPAANKAVARQFEALFLQMVLKSMREATPREGLFDSGQSRLYESLLDQQLGQSLSSGNRGTGLAAMIEAQLARQTQIPDPVGELPLHRAAKTYPLSQSSTPTFIPLRRTPVGPGVAVSSASFGTSRP